MNEISLIENMITKHIQKICGTQNISWYIGITAKPEIRLPQHNANYGSALVIRTSSELTARTAEDYLKRKYKFNGDVGGGTGSNDCIFVYVYPIASDTNQ